MIEGELQIPGASTSSEKGVGYAFIAQHIIQFHYLKAMPYIYNLMLTIWMVDLE